MAKLPASAAEAYSSQIRKALLKAFALPVALAIFYAAAPAWLNHKLHAELKTAIEKSGTLSPDAKSARLEHYARIDFTRVCGSPDPSLLRWRDSLERIGECAHFARLRWSLYLSGGLILLLVVAAATTATLTRRAQRSPAELITSYRSAWRLNVNVAVIKLLLLIPLLTYAAFEVTTLLSNSYYPKLLGIIVLGGAIGLWQSMSALLRSVPLEFSDTFARDVSPAEAPLLWDDVRNAAAQIGTNPPDKILVGMQLNFYVTELAVVHRTGKAVGRTLYLSLPLMHQLAADEILTIIGHELGHFHGDDTRITREFYPMRYRTELTLRALASAGPAGWPSLHTLLFFRQMFARTEQALSRERELLADRISSELTTPATAGRALLKVEVLSEAFQRNIAARRGSNIETIFADPLLPFVKTELAPQAAFWTGLFEKKSPHPLDSHPTLRVRLEALGQVVDPATALAIATTPTDSAYARWFAGDTTLFAEIVGLATKQVGRIRTQQAATAADYSTTEGKKLLDEQFPEVRWTVANGQVWVRVGIALFLAVVCGLIALVLPNLAVRISMLACAVFCVLGARISWQRHRGGILTLTPEGLSYTGWKRPLRFAEIKRFYVKAQYGSPIAMVFVYEKRQPWIWRYGPLARYSAKEIAVPMGLFRGKAKENVQTVFNYYTRQLPT